MQVPKLQDNLNALKHGLWILLFGLCQQAQAWTLIHAGTSVEFLRNPWFVRSAPVSYCVVADLPSNVSSQEAIRAIADSVSFWRKDLQVPQNEILQLAQGEWTELNCEQDEQLEKAQLVFYLGWKSLPRKLKDLAEDLGYPESFTALKSYNKRTLTGEGAIFLSMGTGLPHSGSQQTWSPLWIKAQAVHQLGFVHGYFGPRWGIEAGNFFRAGSKFIRDREIHLGENALLPPLLNQNVEILSCSGKSCLEFKGPNFEGRYYLSRQRGGDVQEAGWISFARKEPNEKKVFNPVLLTLPAEQTVFANTSGTLEGPGNWAWQGPAQFMTKEKGKAQSVYLILDPTSFLCVQGGGKNSVARVLHTGSLWEEVSEVQRSPARVAENHLENRKKTQIFIRERDAKKAKLFLESLEGVPEAKVAE